MAWLGGIFADTQLINLKLIYFTYIASLAVVRPYLALFMYELGLNPFQVGCVKGLEPFVILTCSPGWGSIADKYSIRKSLLIFCAIGSAVFLPLQLFSPPVNFSATSEFPLANSSDRLNFTTEDAGDSSIEDEVSFDVRHQLFPAASQLTFWTVASLAFLDNIFIAGFLPLLDALTMELVKLYPDTSYGGQRWPGAFAVVVFSPVVGILTDWYQNSGISLGDFYFLQSRYLPSFALFSLLIFISVIPVIMMKDAPSNQSPPSFSRELLIIFRDLHVILSFVLFIVAGACKGIVGTFLFLFLDELNASKLLMSLSLVVTCLIETPCLIYSGKVINKLGYEAVFCLGLFAYAVRMFCYSILVNPVYVLPIEMLHGICYGLLWPSCTEYANHIAPQGMSSTLQALAHAAKAGVGEILGVAVGGLLYNIYGARALFRQAACAGGFVLLLYVAEWLLHHRTGRMEPSDEEKANAESTPLMEIKSHE